MSRPLTDWRDETIIPGTFSLPLAAGHSAFSDKCLTSVSKPQQGYLGEECFCRAQICIAPEGRKRDHLWRERERESIFPCFPEKMCRPFSLGRKAGNKAEYSARQGKDNPPSGRRMRGAWDKVV